MEVVYAASVDDCVTERLKPTNASVSIEPLTQNALVNISATTERGTVNSQADHDRQISASINRAMTRTNKTLRGAELSKEQIDVVFNIIRDLMNTVLEEVSEDIVREMILRSYHEPGDTCLQHALEAQWEPPEGSE